MVTTVVVEAELKLAPVKVTVVPPRTVPKRGLMAVRLGVLALSKFTALPIVVVVPNTILGLQA
jgi:hypothetical protein